MTKPTITVLIASSRAPHSFVLYPDWDLWELLARTLAAQTFADFEVVAVTPYVKDATLALGELRQRCTVVPPRDTPWLRERLFAVCSARNTGLIYARGACILGVDDCLTFPPDFLERIAAWWERGLCAAAFYRHENSPGLEPVDARWPWLKLNRGARDSWTIHGEPYPSGPVFAYPLETAIAVNGFDEHFDGARGLEDTGFSRRLISQGVSFVMDRNIVISTYDAKSFSPDIMRDRQHVRCCNITHVLSLQHGDVANRVPYTTEEVYQVLNCPYWREDARCGWYVGYGCDSHAWPSGHPIARRIMVDEGYQDLFDLTAARKEIGNE
jgi:hypothetical protein